jgi:hypothetical protein
MALYYHSGQNVYGGRGEVGEFLFIFGAKQYSI